MMSKRLAILAGMALGLAWAFAVLWFGATRLRLPVFTVMPTIMTAFLGPGAIMALMIGRLAQRRFFDDLAIDGAPLSGGAEVDRRVLVNTTEQLVLAMAIWPAAAILLSDRGPGVIVALSLGFVVARLAFWIGYHIAPPLRAFGFAASFYPTVLVAFWALWSFASTFSG